MKNTMLTQEQPAARRSGGSDDWNMGRDRGSRPENFRRSAETAGSTCVTKSLTVDVVLESVTVECEINRNKTALVI